VTMAVATWAERRFPLPILQGIRSLDRGGLSGDVVAGMTLAALAIPEVMGYTKLAGMPVVTGLYTILLPLAVFAVLGVSSGSGGTLRELWTTIGNIPDASGATVLAQSAATLRAYAARYGDRFSEDVDLVGLGGASVGDAVEAFRREADHGRRD
jgi:Sulfate permease family